MTTDADKALALVGRYARLQARMHECRKTTARLFNACEEPAYLGDLETGSGCIDALRQAISEGELKRGPEGESNWWQLLTDLGFCRPCRLALKVSNHRKRKLTRRRTAILAAMRRLGSKVGA